MGYTYQDRAYPGARKLPHRSEGIGAWCSVPGHVLCDLQRTNPVESIKGMQELQSRQSRK